MKIEEIKEIENRWREGYAINLPSWQNAPSCDLSDKGFFLAHDVPAMITALKQSADKVAT